MKFLQTCWFNNPKKFDAGWLSTKFSLMSWGLSVLSYRKFYDNIELITDSIGQEILINKLALPYSSVSLAQESYKPNIESLWVLRKLNSYALQNEPFIHADGDTFLFKPFEVEILNAPLIAQNFEYNHPYYLQGFEEVNQYCLYVPDYIKPDTDGKISAVNAGIMGGNDYKFYHFFAQEADDFVMKNEAIIHQLEPSSFNIFLEQFLFKKIADFKKISIAYQLKQQIGYPHNYQLDRFWDLPNACDYIHIMNYKKNPTICEQMAQRLYIESPELYERVVRVANELEATKVSMFMGNEAQTLEAFFYRTNLIN